MERVHYEFCHCSTGVLSLFSLSAMVLTGSVYLLLA